MSSPSTPSPAPEEITPDPAAVQTPILELDLPEPDHAATISAETSVAKKSVTAVMALLDEGSTVPFIARYRKEVTGGLDEVEITAVKDRLTFHRELFDRKKTVLGTIASQGKLTDELREAILATETRTALEDLYAPYRPKRRTRATIAKEKGLEPLADRIWAQDDTTGDPLEIAKTFVDAEKGVETVDDALAGARDILAERIAETAEWRAEIRELTRKEGKLRCKAARGKADETSKFQDYYDHAEPVSAIPSHRVLAIRRGEKEGFLSFAISMDEERARSLLTTHVVTERASIWTEALIAAAHDAYDRLLSVQVETDLRTDLKGAADETAVEVFAENLKELLLAAPFGPRGTIGIDPGFRTGCKVAVLDGTGRLVEHGVVYPTEPRKDVAGTEKALGGWISKHDVAAIAIGNGTGGRETFQVVRSYLAENHPQVVAILVNESGASVYSASPVAREELPDVDLTVRGAVSIGRRLQDPLAELVKIDPKSIGVGQYQHDVDQKRLREKLDDVVVSCVNKVGVDANTASASLLSYVAGLGPSLAKALVKHRDSNGPFDSRDGLTSVPRLGAKTFEQCAGFLRIKGSNPLDDSAVHPERYGLVERIASDLGVEVQALVGASDRLKAIEVDRYVGDDVGRYTLDDIVSELEKPGRDPRADFEAPEYRDDVNSIGDLTEGMDLSGVVTNVTHFGAFVDIGVHQDGLVHVSELAHRFVKDASEVVRVGQKVQVRVTSIDRDRNRIGLSMKARQEAPAGTGGGGGRGRRPGRGRPGEGSGQGRGDGQGRRRGKGPAPAPTQREPQRPPISEGPWAKLEQLMKQQKQGKQRGK